MKTKILLTCLFLNITIYLFANSNIESDTSILPKTIKGKVIEKEGEGLQLIGATIIIKNSPTIATTDVNGEFELDISLVKDKNTIIVISYTGFKTAEISIEQLMKNSTIILAEQSIVLPGGDLIYLRKKKRNIFQRIKNVFKRKRN